MENLRRGCLAVFLLLLIVLATALLVLHHWWGTGLDWSALLRLEPPIFVTQYRVVAIRYADKAHLYEAVEERRVSLDLWSAGESEAVAAATAPAIRKLRSAGLHVDVLYQSIDEYLETTP